MKKEAGSVKWTSGLLVLHYFILILVFTPQSSYAYFLMLLIVYLCGSPIVAPSFAFKTCLSYVLKLHCISSLSVPFTIHSSTPTLCSSYLVFLFCVPFFLAVSSIVLFFYYFYVFSFLPNSLSTVECFSFPQFMHSFLLFPSILFLVSK